MTISILDMAAQAARKPGIEPLTPKWAETLTAFYAGKYSELWARVGRRGRKSSTAALMLAYEALHGGHEAQLMPGELGLLVSISKDLAGAEVVRRFARLWLDALRIPYSDTMFGSVRATRVEGTAFAIACLPCTTTAPRGPAIPVAVVDEPAFWETSDAYSQPDTQILAALRPAMAQFPGRKLIGISSPFGKEGVHYNTIERGTHGRVLVVQGPTWEWSPSITEAMTHDLEPDDVTWSREYAAIPGDSAASPFFDPGAVDAAVDRERPLEIPPQRGWLCVFGGDFGFSVNASALACLGYRTDEPDIFHVLMTHELLPQPGIPLRPSEVSKQFGVTLLRYNNVWMLVDGHALVPMQEHAQGHGYVLQAAAAGNPAKVERYTVARTKLHQGQLRLPPDPRVARQLKGVQQKLSPGGLVTITPKLERDGSHGDVADAIVLGVTALTQGKAKLAERQRRDDRLQRTIDSLEDIENDGVPGYIPRRFRGYRGNPAHPFVYDTRLGGGRIH